MHLESHVVLGMQPAYSWETQGKNHWEAPQVPLEWASAWPTWVPAGGPAESGRWRCPAPGTRCRAATPVRVRLRAVCRATPVATWPARPERESWTAVAHRESMGLSSAPKQSPSRLASVLPKWKHVITSGSSRVHKQEGAMEWLFKARRIRERVLCIIDQVTK